MATMGTVKIEIQNRYRRVRLSNETQGWFHGFFQDEKGGAFALVEVDDGIVVGWRATNIEFILPYQPLSEPEQELEKYIGVTTLIKEASWWKKNRGLSSQWVSDGEGFWCSYCGEAKPRNTDKLCFECWDKLSRALSLISTEK